MKRNTVKPDKQEPGFLNNPLGQNLPANPPLDKKLFSLKFETDSYFLQFM